MCQASTKRHSAPSASWPAASNSPTVAAFANDSGDRRFCSFQPCQRQRDPVKGSRKLCKSRGLENCMKRLMESAAGVGSAGSYGVPRRGGVLPWMALLLMAANLLAQPAVTTNSAGALVLTNSFGDLNDDSQVDVRDVVLLTHHLNAARLLSAPMVARADLNLDSAVNAADRSILADVIACRNTKPDEDFDADELPNAEELQRGTNPFLPDCDGDGWLDGWEVTEGTNPFDAQSGLKLFVIARPPVQVVHPLIQDTDNNTFGTVLARPPVQVIHPLIQDTDTNTYGAVLARPPVVVTNPPPQ